MNAILAHCQDLSGIGGVLRPGIVHRLDRDTSGVIVVAKNDACAQRAREAAQGAERREDLHRARRGYAEAGGGRHRRADRPRPAQPPAHGGRRPRAGVDNGVQGHRSVHRHVAGRERGRRRGARTRSVSTSPRSATRSSATVSTASRRRLSAASSCTRGGSSSRTRAPGARVEFDAPLPAIWKMHCGRPVRAVSAVRVFSIDHTCCYQRH